MKNSYGLYSKTYELLIESLQRFEEIDQAILFGSRAMGNFKEGSDIDLAIKGENINLKTITDLSTLLNEEKPIPYFVDIVDLKTIDVKSLIEHILTEGKVIYTKM